MVVLQFSEDFVYESLLKADIECWDERIKLDMSSNFDTLLEELSEIANDFQANALCKGSREVAVDIAG